VGSRLFALGSGPVLRRGSCLLPRLSPFRVAWLLRPRLWPRLSSFRRIRLFRPSLRLWLGSFRRIGLLRLGLWPRLSSFRRIGLLRLGLWPRLSSFRRIRSSRPSLRLWLSSFRRIGLLRCAPLWLAGFRRFVARRGSSFGKTPVLGGLTVVLPGRVVLSPNVRRCPVRRGRSFTAWLGCPVLCRG